MGQTISDHFNQKIPITDKMSYKRMLLRGIWDLINLSHIDPIIQMIPLTMIPLSSAHCNYDDTTLMWISLMIVCLEGGWELQCQGGLSDKYYQINFSLKHTFLLIIKHIQLGLEYLCAFIWVELVVFMFSVTFSPTLVLSFLASNCQTVNLLNSQTVKQSNC